MRTEDRKTKVTWAAVVPQYCGCKLDLLLLTEMSPFTLKPGILIFSFTFVTPSRTKLYDSNVVMFQYETPFSAGFCIARKVTATIVPATMTCGMVKMIVEA